MQGQTGSEDREPQPGTSPCSRWPIARRGSSSPMAAGLDPSAYGTRSMRRMKATLIYNRTKNLRVVRLLLGHSKHESTFRYVGIQVGDALEISEQIEI